MSYRTLEVELENGVVHPTGAEPLPAKALALLTILSPALVAPSGKPELSLADLVAEFRGIGNGTHTDLSTNKRHMDDFGK